MNGTIKTKNIKMRKITLTAPEPDEPTTQKRADAEKKVMHLNYRK